jgi:hypothetical protein
LSHYRGRLLGGPATWICVSQVELLLCVLEHHAADQVRVQNRNYLAHASGDAINAVLAAAGYNFRRLFPWVRFLLFRILIALGLAAQLKA